MNQIAKKIDRHGNKAVRNKLCDLGLKVRVGNGNVWKVIDKKYGQK